MKPVVVLFVLCFTALMQKAAARAVSSASTGTADTVKTFSRGERRRLFAISHGRKILPFPQYNGAPAKAARHDKDLVVRLRAGEITESSDYFKPTTATTADTALLADSGYVKTYRFFAFNGAQRQIIHPVGTGLLIGSGVIVFTTGIILIITALARGKG